MSVKTLYHVINLQVPAMKIAVAIGEDMALTMAEYFELPEEQYTLMTEYLGAFGPTGNSACPYFIYLPEEYNAKVVAHEALHCAVEIMSFIGANLTLPDNDELLCYHMDAIHTLIEEIYTCMSEQ